MFGFLKKLFGGAAAPPARRPTRTEAPASAAAVEAAAPPENKYLRKDPILNRQQRIAAYEFYLERPDSHGRHAWHAATRRFYDESLLNQLSDPTVARLLNQRQAFVSLAPEALDLAQLENLPPGKLVISLVPGAGPVLPQQLTAWLERVRLLKEEKGVGLACAHTLANGPLAEFLGLASHILVAVEGIDPPELLAISRRLRTTYPEAKLMATGVDSNELFEACRAVQFDFFRGHYLTQHQAGKEPDLSSQRLVVTELISQLRRKDPDFDKLAMIARQDLALTIRLLRYINSAAMGLSRKVASLEQAMTFLGHEGLYRWLTLLLFYNSKTSQVDEALRETALVRARLCELLAKRRLGKAECEQAFVTGLLSMVDVLFHMPLEQAVGMLGLPEDIQLALLKQEGRYGAYLGLALACERGDQDTVNARADACGLSPAQVNGLHLEALTWAVDYDSNLESGD